MHAQEITLKVQWSVEQNLGVTVASLPVLRPYLAILVGGIKNLISVFSPLHLFSSRQDASQKLRWHRESPGFQESDRNRLVPLGEISINHSGIRKETRIKVERS